MGQALSHGSFYLVAVRLDAPELRQRFERGQLFFEEPYVGFEALSALTREVEVVGLPPVAFIAQLDLLDAVAHVGLADDHRV